MASDLRQSGIEQGQAKVRNARVGESYWHRYVGRNRDDPPTTRPGITVCPDPGMDKEGVQMVEKDEDINSLGEIRAAAVLTRK
ncbi:hypothetical protein PoB_001434000 [Plakobranchus ocellatus]|uniref:Uncharacterized protein n=1 Tax=Plakobranchus ocellatus TaxID=259542 RepID=A0AAV3YZJ6_9GAST|nr:hypothetical protein PoB_001434000 [Plakobranchus ocellatus]